MKANEMDRDERAAFLETDGGRAFLDGIDARWSEAIEPMREAGFVASAYGGHGGHDDLRERDGGRRGAGRAHVADGRRRGSDWGGAAMTRYVMSGELLWKAAKALGITVEEALEEFDAELYDQEATQLGKRERGWMQSAVKTQIALDDERERNEELVEENNELSEDLKSLLGFAIELRRIADGAADAGRLAVIDEGMNEVVDDWETLISADESRPAAR